MKRNRIVYGLLCMLPAAALGDSATWEGKPIAEWSAEEAREVLAHSPWAKAAMPAILPLRSEDQLRDGGRMGGGARRSGAGFHESGAEAVGEAQGTPVEVRWESALPIRAAELKAGEVGAPDWDGAYYAIAVYDVPGVTAAAQRELRGELKRTTVLRRSGKKDLKPERVEIELTGKNFARILYLFPRLDPLTGGSVAFVSQIGRVVVSQTFDTGAMRFQGTPQF